MLLSSEVIPKAFVNFPGPLAIYFSLLTFLIFNIISLLSKGSNALISTASGLSLIDAVTLKQ